MVAYQHKTALDEMIERIKRHYETKIEAAKDDSGLRLIAIKGSDPDENNRQRYEILKAENEGIRRAFEDMTTEITRTTEDYHRGKWDWQEWEKGQGG